MKSCQHPTPFHSISTGLPSRPRLGCRAASRSPAEHETAILDSSRQRPFRSGPLAGGSAPHLQRGSRASRRGLEGGGRDGKQNRGEEDAGWSDAVNSGTPPKPPQRAPTLRWRGSGSEGTLSAPRRPDATVCWSDYAAVQSATEIIPTTNPR